MLTAAVRRDTMRLVIIDGHPLIRDRMMARLSRESGIEVIATGGTAEAAIAYCEREQPDVLLIDPLLPDTDTAELVTLLRFTSPETKIIVITETPGHSSVIDALAAGAAGLMMKNPADLASPAARVSGIPDRSFCQTTAVRAAISPITPREREVTRLVADGHTNLEIAVRLNLSNNTIKSYLRNAMHKLQARNRAQLVTNARRHGLL